MSNPFDFKSFTVLSFSFIKVMKICSYSIEEAKIVFADEIDLNKVSNYTNLQGINRFKLNQDYEIEI